MRRGMVILGISWVFVYGPAQAVEIFDLRYMVETYLTYPHVTKSGYMEFDSNGNMYISYEALGTIDRVDTDKSVTMFVTGLTEPRNLVWTGGTVYGDNLYVADHSGHKIVKVSMEGNKTTFVNINSPQGIALDRVGGYGGYLYTGPRVSDHVDRILQDGTLQKFSDFPYGMPGGPCDFTFDTGMEYGGLMYVGTDSVQNVNWRGVHSLDKNGNPTRFAPDIVEASQIKFDEYGMFDNKLFIGGRKNSSDPWEIWRADPDGTTTLFARGSISGNAPFTFGPDGAMYVHESANNIVTISRISLIPEPATLSILGLGGLIMLCKKKSNKER